MPDDPDLRASVSELVAESRVAAATVTRRRRRATLWLVPVASVAALALTAGAIVTDNLLHADLPIPITYTTDTGVTVSCTAHIGGGSLFAARSIEVIDYYQHHDFTGVGQRIYDYALVLSGDREVTPGVLPQSSEWVPEPGQRADDDMAFQFSLTSFLLTDTMVELHIQGSGDTWQKSDCTGQLH